MANLKTMNVFEVSSVTFALEHSQTRLTWPVAGRGIDSGAPRRTQQALRDLSHDASTGERSARSFEGRLATGEYLTNEGYRMWAAQREPEKWPSARP